MRLLIIEDEQALADMVAQHLRTAGYEIDVCYDGDSGLEAATTESYDLIILDLNLPKMDGGAFEGASNPGRGDRRIDSFCPQRD